MSQTALQQQLGEIEDEIVSLNDLLSDPDLSDEEKESIDQQIDTKMSQRKIIAKRVEREKATLELVNNGRKPRKEEAPKEVQNLEETPEEIRIPREYFQRVNVRRYQPKNVHGEVDGIKADARAYWCGKWAFGVAASTNPGSFGHLQHHRADYEKRFGPMAAATEGGNAGFWVPETFSSDFVSLMQRYGIARQVCDVRNMSSDTMTFPKEGADPTPVFEGELSAGNDITPADESNVRLVAKKLMGILVQSAELSEDAITEFGDSLIRRLGNGFAKKEDDCLFQGDGTSTYGGIVGLKTKLQDVDGAGTDSAGLVQGSGSTWASLVRGDFSKVVGKLPHYADDGPMDLPSAMWIVHRTFYHEVMFDIGLAASGAEAREIFGGVNRPMFMGYPVMFSNSMPKTTASGEVVATFGDHRRAVSFGDRRAFAISFSTEATIGSTNMFESYGLATRGFERFDINVHSVGDSSDAGPVVCLATQ